VSSEPIRRYPSATVPPDGASTVVLDAEDHTGRRSAVVENADVTPDVPEPRESCGARDRDEHGSEREPRVLRMT
jgi:hypothetical protein